MRIFSIHKSKSKKKVSEKSPKLAAQKFLEKRKVGTVIYLHEHPSGKIHGPYRKEYDKKIMKGGGFFGISSVPVSEFRIDRPRNSRTPYPPVLEGTEQLIIKIIHSGLFEPRIFFGDNRKIDNRTKNHYFTYVCKNKDYNINNLISFRKLKDSVNGAPPQIKELTLEEVKKIPPEILLGFYTQYIDRCKENFSGGRQIVFRLMYMRRLFFYLFYHILPIITMYIVNTYFKNINLNPNSIQRLKSNFEIKYFMNILSFIQRIDPIDIVNEICFTCNIPITDERIISIKKKLIKSMNDLKKKVSNQQGLRENIRNNPFAGLAHGMAIAGIVSNPIQVVQVTGGILSGLLQIFGALR